MLIKTTQADALKKIANVVLMSLIFLFGASNLGLAAGTVKMRIVVVNPSTTKTQNKDLMNYLPKETTLKNVLDNGGLEVDYDREQGLFYVHKKGLELTPLETKVFEVILEDVWFIPEETLGLIKTQTNNVMEKLKNTAYFSQAEKIAKSIVSRVDDIEKSQNDPVSKDQKIAYYRENQGILAKIREDMQKLEKLLVAVGGPPNLELIEKSDINLKSPSSKTTWVVIFIVLIFIGILSATFYFTWMRQASLTENIFTKEKDSSFAEFKTTPGPKLDEPEKKP